MLLVGSTGLLHQMHLSEMTTDCIETRTCSICYINSAFEYVKFDI